MKTLEVKKNRNIRSTETLSLTRCITSGVETKFWTKIDGEDYLFKASRDKSPTDIGEVFYAYLCKLLNMPSLEICFCTGKANVLSPKLNGVASKSYLTNDVISAYSCKEISDFNYYYSFKNNDDTVLSSKRDVEAIMQHLNKFAEINNLVVDKDVEKNLKEMICLDILTGQIDRHFQNIEFLEYRDKDGKNRLRMAPAFDNGRCFNLSFQSEKIYDGVPILPRTMLVDTLEVRKMFGIIEKIVSDKDVYNFYLKARQINIEKTIQDFERDYDYTIVDDLKKNIIRIWNNSFRNIRTRLKDYVIKEYNFQDTELDERFALAVPEMKAVVADYNYFYDCRLYKKAKLKIKPNLKEYIKQQKQYQMMLYDWADGILKEKPNLQKFPLLVPRNKNAKIFEMYQSYSKKEKEKRSNIIKKYIQENMPIDYFKIARLQNEYDFKLNNSNARIKKSVKNSFIPYEQNEFTTACDNYIQYGEDFASIPSLNGYNTLKNKKYSVEVIEQYLKEQIIKDGFDNLNSETKSLAKEYNIDLVTSEENF